MFNLEKFLSMLGKNRMTRKELANILGISVASLYRRISNAGNFTTEEIRKMISLFGKEDVLECLFY